VTTERDDLVASLGQFPTAVISDALDELGFVGAIPHVQATVADQRVVAGIALTARFERVEDDPAAHRFGGGVGRPLEQVLRAMRAGQMVVMDLDGSRTASAWGGLASRLAQRTGVSGTVLYGTCRDVDEIRDLSYPVWAVGTHPRRSRGTFTFGSLGGQLDLGGVVVRSGDIVVGDATGIVCVPIGLAARTRDLAVSITAAEGGLVDQIDADALVDWDQV